MDSTDKPVRLAVVVSHPVQHFTPLYQALAAHRRIDLKVFYASRIGAEPYYDEQMRTEISWNMDLLGGYQHVFLENADRIKSTDFFSINNRNVAAELGEFDPDALLIYGYGQLTMLRALWWGRLNNVPAMMIGDSQLKMQRTFVRRMVKQAVLPVVLRQFSCFLTVGDCNEDYYRQYGVTGDRFFRSPFTIDEGIYRSARDDRAALRQQMRASLDIADDEFVVLSVGKLAGHKRAGDVVAVAQLLKDQPAGERQISFMMAGDGELMSELRSAVAANDLPVKLLGFVNVDRLPSIYAAADVVIHPSAIDSHPLVMSEAACIGLPLIVSDRVGAIGPSDIARPDENTIVVPCGDVTALADAVRRLSGNRDMYAGMAARSLDIFDAQDVQCSVDGVLDALDYCLNRAAKA